MNGFLLYFPFSVRESFVGFARGPLYSDCFYIAALVFQFFSIDRPITTRWQGKRVMRREKKKGFPLSTSSSYVFKTWKKKSTRTIYDGDGEALGADDNPQPTRHNDYFPKKTKHEHTHPKKKPERSSSA